MTVDAIGGALGGQDTQAASRSQISQDDFIRLFLAQLQFQDPLEPLDNREFLAQLAQFSGLEQARQTTQGVDNLLLMSSGAQALSLLDRDVQVATDGSSVTGKVIAVNFTANGPELTVQPGTGPVVPGLRMAQVQLVRP